MTPSKLIAVAAATLALTACGSAQKMTSPAMQSKSTPTQSSDGVLIGPKGMTLYTFAKDSANSGTSACNGPCAVNWPPLAVSDKAQALGHYTIITRADGSKQWAYKGMPLYYFAKDKKPGDKLGDGLLNGNWRVARP